MKTLLMSAIVGVILFAASASVSWYLMNQQVEPVAAEPEGTDLETDAGVPPIGDGVAKQEQMPVANRPDLPLTVEAVLELSESIRKKERELMEREKRAEKTERNIELLFEDLKVERAELSAISQQIQARLRQASNSVAQLKIENQQLTNQTEELAKLKPNKNLKPGEEPLDEIGERVKTAKKWFEGLGEEQAANYLKEFANNGDLEFAARLLKSLSDRKSTKILAAFDDSEFVQQILDALSVSKKETDTPDARKDAASQRLDALFR